jgi:integrase
MLRTKNGLPEYCSWNEDRHGTRRVRFRKGRLSIYIAGIPWSEAFMRAYATALEGEKAQAGDGSIGAARTIPGSFDALCVAYYKSAEFLGLEESTQRARRNIIEKFRREDENGKKPLNRLGRAQIKIILGDKAKTPEAANSLLKTLRLMLNFAVDIAMIPVNPALGIKRYKSKGEGTHTWSEAEVDQFRAVHALGTKPRLALELLRGLGQRRSDMVRMGWQHVRGGNEIAVRQKKTDEALWLPLPPELKAALAMVPRTNMTFLLTEQGKPFSTAGFGNWFRDQCDAAGLPQCSAHGLRKAKGTAMADAGCSMDQIKATLGHRSSSAVEPYIKAANQRRLARQGLVKELSPEPTETGTERGDFLVQPPSKAGQKAS